MHLIPRVPEFLARHPELEMEILLDDRNIDLVQEDVTFHEDASRIRRAPGIFARLRSFAYNILRFNQSDTIAQDRYAAALGGIEALNNIKYFK
jgi:DNA-binding transcriptional LysR family regulator